MVSVLYMPDGNRRFAQREGLPYLDSYLRGGNSLALGSEFFICEGRANQFIYHAMSGYTHRRIEETKAAILEAATRTLEGLAACDFFLSRGLRFRGIDHTKRLPNRIKKAVAALEEKHPETFVGEVVVLLGYSLEEDMNQALARHPKDYQELRQSLLFPDIDLVLRNGEMRPSGGPVYAMGQAQMITLKPPNPELSREELEAAWREFQELKIRHEKTSGLFR